MTWESIIDQMKEWVNDQGFLTTGFVDRGDPPTLDFDQNDLTFDGAAHDLDLSAIVPSGAKAVSMLVCVNDNAVGRSIFFRKNGNAFWGNHSNVQTQVALQDNWLEILVICDGNRIIEYRAPPVPMIVIQIFIKGWWL